MGVNLDNNERIAGYRPAVFKSALKSYARSNNPSNLIDLKALFPHRRDGAIVFEECLDRGLINPESLQRTESGDVVARSKVQPRTPIAKADTVLDRLLDRASAMNADCDAPSQVDEIWLFGSMLQRRETVGDIDLAIRTSRRAPPDEDADDWIRRVDALYERYGDAPERLAQVWERESWLESRALYGPARHPILAPQDGVGDLVSLSVPCRLIFDRQRGGRVDDPILPFHPESTGRCPELPMPAERPDLTAAPIRPMDGRWIARYRPWGGVCPYSIFRGWTDDAQRVFGHYPEHLRIFGDDYQVHRYPWTPKALKRGGLDGREALLMVDATETSGLSIVFRRRVDVTDGKWTLRAEIDDVELNRARKHIDFSALPSITGAIVLILAVDAERMLRRSAEMPLPPTVEISLQRTGLMAPLQDFLVDRIAQKLQARAVVIEPSGYDRTVSINVA